MMSMTPPRFFPWPATGSDERLGRLVERLAEADGAADDAGDWPSTLWSILFDEGATRWVLPRELGGDGLARSALLEYYARVASGSLTAAFILSQHDAGVRRLLVNAPRLCADHWIAEIAAGRAFTTVGLSQLTTSRRHGAQALLAVEVGPGRYRLDGAIPWVTGAIKADVVVVGAVLEDGQQLLIALPNDRPGFSVQPPFELAALQASCTSEITCDGVLISDSDLLAGPSADVLSTPGSAGTGGLETSALALGQARAALDMLTEELPRREDLEEPVEAMSDAWSQLWQDLTATAEGLPGAQSPGHVRGQANALALRTTQAYLTARKGTGFLRSDPAQRWARQALFFLVWSCPSPVAQAAIRDLAGLCSL